MELDPDVCARAARSRDPRFDGRFFVGVVTTGVYCRSICPAPPAKPANVRFFPTAAAAAAAGLRPCRRCRPEAAPGTPEWPGAPALLTRAVRLIDGGFLDRRPVTPLAAELSLSERQLRGLFASHLGAGPLAVARARRLRLARLLVDQTELTMTEVAFAAGFSGTRQFNRELRRAFGRPPSQLRRAARPKAGPRSGELTLRLAYRPPLDWGAFLRFVAPRAIPGVEAVEGACYRRSVRLDGTEAIVELEDEPRSARLAVRMRPAADGIPILLERVRRLADLDADPLRIESDLARDARLAPLMESRPGLRVPGAWDPFELAVRAVLGQQVSVAGATTLAGRLVRAFGSPLARPEGAITHLFPTPRALAGAPVETIGVPRSRAETVRSLAAAVARGELALDQAGDREATLEALCAVRGIGSWTAQYVAMRALRDPDAWPASDLGLRHALGSDGAPASPSEMAAHAEGWRPWRAYAATHLWLAGSAPLQAAA